MRAVCLCSGGLDSTTLLYDLVAQGATVRALSIDYGQRHVRELDAAARLARRRGVPWSLVRIAGWRGPSALQDGALPDGPDAATVVPGRNAVFLSLAYAVALAEGADTVAFAAHAGDAALFPDCRPGFCKTFWAMQDMANGGDGPALLTPYLAWSKAEIAAHARALGVPIDATWSCYAGGAVPCQRCGACVARAAALRDAGVVAEWRDPT